VVVVVLGHAADCHGPPEEAGEAGPESTLAGGQAEELHKAKDGSEDQGHGHDGDSHWDGNHARHLLYAHTFRVAFLVRAVGQDIRLEMLPTVEAGASVEVDEPEAVHRGPQGVDEVDPRVHEHLGSTGVEAPRLVQKRLHVTAGFLRDAAKVGEKSPHLAVAKEPGCIFIGHPHGASHYRLFAFDLAVLG
jgi:hypothetical protein